MSGVWGGGGKLIGVRRGEVLDVSSARARSETSPAWIGDRVAGMLERLLELTHVMPSWLKAMGFAKDRKQAYVYMQRFVRLGVVEKTEKYGVYRVRHDVIVKLLQLPVRRISEGLRKTKEKLQLLTNGGGVRRASPCGRVCPSVRGLGGLGCLLIMLGCWGWCLSSVFCWWGGLVEVRDLRLFYDGVCYFEVTQFGWWCWC